MSFISSKRKVCTIEQPPRLMKPSSKPRRRPSRRGQRDSLIFNVLLTSPDLCLFFVTFLVKLFFNLISYSLHIKKKKSFMSPTEHAFITRAPANPTRSRSIRRPYTVSAFDDHQNPNLDRAFGSARAPSLLHLPFN